MYTLHHAAAIRSIDTVDELNSVAATVKPEEIRLARQSSPPSTRRSIWPPTKTNTGRRARSGSSTRRSPAKRSSHRGRGATESRQPDGRAEEEPRRGELHEKEASKGGRAQGRRSSGQAQTSVAPNGRSFLLAWIVESHLTPIIDASVAGALPHDRRRARPVVSDSGDRVRPQPDWPGERALPAGEAEVRRFRVRRARRHPDADDRTFRSRSAPATRSLHARLVPTRHCLPRIGMTGQRHDRSAT